MQKLLDVKVLKVAKNIFAQFYVNQSVENRGRKAVKRSLKTRIGVQLLVVVSIYYY